MEILQQLKNKENKVVGGTCPRLKCFFKEINSLKHIYRYHDSINISGDIFQQLDELDGIVIYDYITHTIYYTSLDSYMNPLRFITNKGQDKQVWLARKNFNKILSVPQNELGIRIGEINFAGRKIRTGENHESKQTSLI